MRGRIVPAGVCSAVSGWPQEGWTPSTAAVPRNRCPASTAASSVVVKELHGNVVFENTYKENVWAFIID